MMADLAVNKDSTAKLLAIHVVVLVIWRAIVLKAQNATTVDKVVILVETALKLRLRECVTSKLILWRSCHRKLTGFY